jgi:uncharacterized RDD family membrane protein YckC
MKCPKCQYLGFDGQTRCRHCGYDLSLVATTELTAEGTDPVAAAEAEAPDTLFYRPEPSARAQARAAIQKRAASRTPQPESFDLPLFAQPGVDDRPALPASRPPLAVRRPVHEAPRARAAAAAAFAPAPMAEPAGLADTVASRVTVPPGMVEAPVPEPGLALSFDTAPAAVPLGGERLAGGTLELPGREASSSIGVARAPDAVPPPSARRPLVNDDGTPRRRSSIVVPEMTGPAADIAEAPTVAVGAVPATAVEVDPAAAREVGAAAMRETDGAAAPLGRRIAGGLIDLTLLAAVDAAVVVATLNATGLAWADVKRLPLAPLAVFLVLLAVGYLAMCTVLAGRTIGQSIVGLAVLETGGRPVRLAPAVVRAAIQVLTVPAAGLGFLPALLGADRRALYDRLAGTDVVLDARGGGPRSE